MRWLNEWTTWREIIQWMNNESISERERVKHEWVKRSESNWPVLSWVSENWLWMNEPNGLDWNGMNAWTEWANEWMKCIKEKTHKPMTEWMTEHLNACLYEWIKLHDSSERTKRNEPTRMEMTRDEINLKGNNERIQETSKIHKWWMKRNMNERMKE